MNLNKIIDHAFMNLSNKIMHLSSEDIIKVPKYLFGYDIHQEYKKRRQEIKEDGSIENKVLKIGLNYASEAARQTMRYYPLATETFFVVTHAFADPPFILSAQLFAALAQAETVRIIEYNIMLQKRISGTLEEVEEKFNKFEEELYKILEAFKRNAYRRLNEIFDEDPEFKAFLRGRLLDNPYAALGLEKTATLEDIKHAYRKIALECHPDKNPNYNDDIKERFLKATQAYYQLTEQYKKL